MAFAEKYNGKHIVVSELFINFAQRIALGGHDDDCLNILHSY